MAKNLNHLNVLFASANWGLRDRAVALMGCRHGASLPETRQNHTKAPPRRPKQRLLSSSRVPEGQLGRKPP
jgi:hypothetical protein